MAVESHECYLTLLHSDRPKLHTILAFLSAIGFAHGSIYENPMQERSTNSPMKIDFHTGSGHENVKKSLMMYKITLCSWDFWAIFTTIFSVFSCDLV